MDYLEELLSQDEKDEWFFLSRELTKVKPGDTVVDVVSRVDNFPIVEMLYRLKRYDILVKNFKTNIDDIDAKTFHNFSDYSLLLLEINERLSKEDVRSLFFLMKSYIGQNFEKTFLNIIIKMESTSLVSPDNLNKLNQCMRTIHRFDLSNKIARYEESRKAGGNYS